MDKYINKYITQLNNLKLPEHRQYELLCSLENNHILWDDIPTDFCDKYDVPHAMDYGVDTINLLLVGADLWIYILNQVKDYISINNKLPSSIDKDKAIKTLGWWVSNQKTNYKKEIKIMNVIFIKCELIGI